MSRAFFVEISTPCQAMPFVFKGRHVVAAVWLWFAVGVMDQRITELLRPITLTKAEPSLPDESDFWWIGLAEDKEASDG